MEIFHYKHKLLTFLKSQISEGKTIGFVPTMGALHEGHLSLINAAKENCDLTIASIFVNPKQFDKKEDLVKYPRQEKADNEKLASAGCNIVYLAQEYDLYDADYKHINLDLAHLENIYEGEKREGHFEGVVQVLYQLFDCIKPTDVFFGQKDFQQCMVVKKLNEAYFPNITLHTVPTYRDDQGLALSSRNALLSLESIQIAQKFNKGLNMALNGLKDKGKHLAIAEAIQYLEQSGLEVEYLDLANAENLTPCSLWEETPQNIVAIGAVWLEGVRLIDNLTSTQKSAPH